MNEAAVNGADVWEPLLGALAEANAALERKAWAEGRDRVLAALSAAGFEVTGAEDMDDTWLGALPPHWLIVSGASMEDGYSFFVVPESALPAELQQALEGCDRQVVSAIDTAQENLALWRDWVPAALATGLRTRDDFEADLAEVPESARPRDADWDRYADAEERVTQGMLIVDGKRLNAQPLNTRIARITHFFERV